MFLLVKIFSIGIILYSGLLIVKPELMRRILDFVKKGNRLYVANAVKTIIGIIMMFAAPYYGTPWVVLFIGAIITFSGITVFILKKSVIAGILEKIEKLDKKKIYILGIIGIAVGSLLILAA